MNGTPLRRIHVGFRVAIAVVFLLVLGGLVAIQLRFGRYLTGDIPTDDSAQILTKLDTAKFDSAEKRLTDRQKLPYPADDLRDVFNPIPTTPP